MREKSGVFGEATDEYEAARSGYPDQLVLDILDFARPVDRALEIGAGTGKATRSFVQHSVDLTCLEPDARMAAVLSRVTSEQSSITVVESTFEAWQSTKKFDLVYAAQSWHWVDSDRRLTLAHDALVEHGTLALFWNRYAPISQELQTILLETDQRHGVDPTIHTPHEHSAEFYSGDIVIAEGTPEHQLSESPTFYDFTSRRYRRIKTFPSSLYLDLLTSISAYRMLEASRRTEYLAEIEQILRAIGGFITLSISSDLFLSKRS